MHPGLLLLLPGSLVLVAWLPLSSPTPSTVKPGICPDLQHEPKLHGKYCSLDTSCPGNEKCCKTSHGQQCVFPDGVFYGYCPNLDLRPGVPSTCLAECRDDYDCFGDLPRKRCCSFGHWRLCMEAIEEHPGVCPLRQMVQTYAPCKDNCSDDQDCPLHQKCCFTGCSRDCLDSVRSKQCRLPPEKGPCEAAFSRYYYNAAQKTCLKFSYGGCHGNSNNFKTREECQTACGKIGPEVCKQPSETGPCLGRFQRYYYNSTSKSCQTFIYGGCGGNNNRFHTKLECLMVCGRPGKCKVQ